MYTKNNTTYAEAGHVLVMGDGTVAGLSAAGEMADFTEAEAPVSEMRIDKKLGMALWARGYLAVSVRAPAAYADFKRRLVKLRYSNDDQIAVMLNGDDDEMRRMQAWREWAAAAAKKICELLNI